MSLSTSFPSSTFGVIPSFSLAKVFAVIEVSVILFESEPNSLLLITLSVSMNLKFRSWPMKSISIALESIFASSWQPFLPSIQLLMNFGLIAKSILCPFSALKTALWRSLFSPSDTIWYPAPEKIQAISEFALRSLKSRRLSRTTLSKTIPSLSKVKEDAILEFLA